MPWSFSSCVDHPFLFLPRYRNGSKIHKVNLNPCAATDKRSVDKFIPVFNWNVSVLVDVVFYCGWLVEGQPTPVKPIYRCLRNIPAHILNTVFWLYLSTSCGAWCSLSVLEVRAGVSRTALGWEYVFLCTYGIG